MTGQLPGNGWAHKTIPASARPSTPRDASFWRSGAPVPFGSVNISTTATLVDGVTEHATKRQKLDVRGRSSITSLNTGAHTLNSFVGPALSPREIGSNSNEKCTPTSAKSQHETPVEPCRVNGTLSLHHLPFPIRPQQNAKRKLSAKNGIPAVFSKIPAQIKPYTPEIPALAPRYDGGSRY